MKPTSFLHRLACAPDKFQTAHRQLDSWRVTKENPHMKHFLLCAAACAAAVLTAGCGGSDGHAAFSAAVYGDAPYGADLASFKATPNFIANINSDKDLSLVMHAGDLHSGSEPCTQVYDQAIAAFFTKFTLPLVYTPGDNEWEDCQKSKQMNGKYTATAPELGYAVNTTIPSYAGGDPVANLQLVRDIFFSQAGKTLGSGSLTVRSQALEGKTSSDKQFVENVWWMKSGVLFTTVNIPGGSNNGTDVWFGAATATDQQKQEVANRTAATKAWLTNAFDQADANGASSVVLLVQADMWSAEEVDNPPRLSEYKQYIDIIADRTAKFGKPVLLINGDTHLFQSDNPLMKGASCVKEPVAASGSTSGGTAQACSFDPYNKNQAGVSYAVKNFHRLVVHGSTMPLEWLKLKVEPGANADNGSYAFGPFSWERKFVQ